MSIRKQLIPILSTTDLVTDLVFRIDKDPNEPHKFQLTFFHRYSFEADSEEQVNPDTSS